MRASFWAFLRWNSHSVASRIIGNEQESGKHAVKKTSLASRGLQNSEKLMWPLCSRTQERQRDNFLKTPPKFFRTITFNCKPLSPKRDSSKGLILKSQVKISRFRNIRYFLLGLLWIFSPSQLILLMTGALTSPLNEMGGLDRRENWELIETWIF